MMIRTNTPLDNLLGSHAELSEDMARSLSEEGYVILPNMADAETLEVLRRTFDEIDEKGALFLNPANHLFKHIF